MTTKRLLVAIAILLIIGLVGSQAFPFAKDWIASRPEAAEQWYNNRLFEGHANKVMNCIDKSLNWSRAIGITQSDRGDILFVLVHLLPQNLRDIRDWESLGKQFQIVVSCSRYIPDWEKLSLIGHSIDQEVGFDVNGKPSVIYKPMVIAVMSLTKEQAILFLLADKPGEFLDAHFSDGTIGLTIFTVRPKQTLSFLHGDRVVGAIEQFREWQKARANEIELMKQEIKEAAKQNILTPVP